MRSGNKRFDGLKKELFALCRSDSLSEDGLREIIIERYGAPKNQNITDYSFFHEACRNELVAEGNIRLLLEYFPNAASACHAKGFTPLHYMCGNKKINLGMVQLLIDAFPESIRRATDDGWTHLHVLCANEEINEEAALEILKLLHEKSPESVRQTTNKGNLPLHIAAEKQSPDFCRILIEAYPGSERMTNSDLPFHRACQWNTVATVEYLYKLYPESISVANNNGQYPIHFVIRGLNYREDDDPEAVIEVLQFLLECNTDVALQKHREKFPLYWVCDEATSDNSQLLNAYYIEVLQVLYDVHPEAIKEDEITSNVDSFCQEVQTFVNNQLIHARQATDHRVMTTPDESGRLPLHRALRDNATLGSIKLLVKGNPSAVQTVDNSGTLPLHLACQHHGSPSVVEYLIDINSSTLEMKDRWQNTVLHHACCGANHVMIAFLLEKYDAAFVSTNNSSKQLPIDLLFDSETVSDREGIEYMESIYRLIRANPETVMGCDIE